MTDSNKKAGRNHNNIRARIGGGFLFFLILIFLLFFMQQCFKILFRKDVASYMIKSGALAVNNSYNAFLIKEELTYDAASSGTIVYLKPEGGHISSGDKVYAICSEETANAVINDPTINSENTDSLARQAKEYSESFTPLAFDTVYGFKEAFCDNATKITVGELTDRLERYAANGSAVSYRVSKETGYLVYGVDGYENITAENVTPEIVNSYPIEASELSSGSNINMGDMAYKLIVSENWKAAFTVTPDYAALFENGQNVKVRFSKNGEELTGKVTLVPGATEKSDVLMMISFKTSVCNFAADRFADIEIDMQGKGGLKVPNSAIVQKKFFVVPKSYALESEENTGETSPLTETEDQNMKTFLKKTYMENGEATVLKTQINVYSENDEFFFVKAPELNYGDELVPQNSQKTYIVEETGILTGVYNINKGYADFCQIQVIDSNEEYSIVKSNTVYGLREFDYIILNAQAVEDDEFIFK